MPTKQTLTLIQGDDPNVALTVLNEQTALDLTGLRVEILVKRHHNSPDTDDVFTLSSVGSAGITIDNASEGLATADFSDKLETPGTFWYRAYVANAGDATVDRHTWAYGDLVILSV
jgi:hypothetical protein